MSMGVMRNLLVALLLTGACADTGAAPEASASKAAAPGGASSNAPAEAAAKATASKPTPSERAKGGQQSSQYPPPPSHGYPPPFPQGYYHGNHMEHPPPPHWNYPPHHMEYPPAPHMHYPPPHMNHPPPHLGYPPPHHPPPYGMDYAPLHHAPSHGMPQLPRPHGSRGGVVTKAELTYIFPMIDANQDGKASVGELQAFNLQTAKSHAQSLHRMPQGLDANKDGKLSLEELRAARSKLGKGMRNLKSEDMANEQRLEEDKFEQADADKNALLEGEELVIFFNPDLDHEVSLIEAKYMFEDLDKDKNELISNEEFRRGGLAASFGQVDKDKDGSIDLAELHHWATGVQDLLWNILHLLKVADKDDDSHLSLSELIKARHRLYKTGGDFYLRTWADVHNEL
eukprot:TRINITY_DN49159_c0_g1_i1.p1 TRINITY_DN49159_c0_g1~~TRINITY_DN49159_c0_g1_i1.p1  ORF type:complete len:410 (+),score=86.91 TRINITY_DN49159_c0_g1_i1:34-1230(+)